jgi:EmrB/QacA subfamily drug resistance transporter
MKRLHASHFTNLSPSACTPAFAGAPALRRDRSEGDRRRWLILALVVLAQLMVVLDATIVNIALPSAQRALHFSNGQRQWIITGYALAFGSLLPLGGRLGDVFGRKRTFVVGAVGFAAVSAFGGTAQSFDWLLAARVLQGVFGALLAPAALATLTTTFTEPGERSKAFGIFGAVASSGAAVGLLLGGALTEYLSWRWCLYVNLALAVPTAVGALALLKHVPLPSRPHLDLPGATTAAVGLFLIVFGFDRAQADGWTAAITLSCLVAGVALLAVFAAIESRSKNPLLPLRLFRDRNRSGSYLAMLFIGVGMFGVFLFVTYYFQGNLGYSPVKSGIAFLPMIGAIILTSVGVNALLLQRLGPRPLITAGMALAAVGMVVLTRLGADSTYATDVLPSLVIVGAGIGLVFPAATNTATDRIDPADAGAASSLVNVGQQVGGSIGTSLLNTVAISATTTYLSMHRVGPAVAAHATVHGYTVAFWWSAAIFALGGLVCALLLAGRKSGAAAEEGVSRRATAPRRAPGVGEIVPLMEEEVR